MRLKLNYERSLKKFLGETYKELPLEDMEMFCLLTGAGVARMLGKMMANLPDVSIEINKQEDKVRSELYDNCYNLIKGYICEINNMNDKQYYSWYKDMQRKFEENKVLYSEKCKEEADKIMMVVFEHMIKKFFVV